MPADRLQAVIPHNHLLAELAAFPFASEAALEVSPVALSAALGPSEGAGTTRLWRAAEQDLVPRFPGLSIDSLVHLRDYVWFPQEPPLQSSQRSYPLYRLLTTHARAVLAVRGSQARPRPIRTPQPAPCQPGAAEAEEAEARWAWRWLVWALPPDLLLAALPAASVGIDVMPYDLDRMLADQGYAELHLHLGASLRFPAYWSVCQYALADPAFRSDAFASPGACLGEGRLLAPWMLRAALARLVIARFLREDGVEFSDWFWRAMVPRVRDGAGLCMAHRLATMFQEFAAGQAPHPERWAEEQALYQWASGVTALPPPKTLLAAWGVDPVSHLFPAAGRGGLGPDLALLRAALSRVRADDERGDVKDSFARVFWQIIRVRSLLYRHLIQRPRAPGLQWFVRFYERMRPLASYTNPSLLVHCALENAGAGRGLRSLEFRVGLPERPEWLLELVEAATAAKPAPSPPGYPPGPQPPLRPEIGVVLHFIRDRGGGAMVGQPSAHAEGTEAFFDAGGRTGGYRYASIYRSFYQKAMNVAALMSDFPRVLITLRGLDVCTDELGVPLWVVAPCFNYLRWCSRQVSIALSWRQGLDVPPLRATAHAGEDWVHLLGGLRRVDESIQYLRLQEGDRLGHGMSLGVDPARWAAAIARVVMPREERLLDLTWEWSSYARHAIACPANRLALLERELARLSSLLFGAPQSPFQLEQMIASLHDRRALVSLGFPHGSRLPSAKKGAYPHLDLAHRWLTDPSVFHQGRVLEWVELGQEVEAMRTLQAWLRRRVASVGLAVEVNPSSNLLIGNVQDLTGHPLWRLNPPRASDEDLPPVTLVIGSDNPLTFATELREEYGLVHDALLRAGLTHQEALSWLDGVRAAGLHARFTLSRGEEPSVARCLPIGGAFPVLEPQL